MEFKEKRSLYRLAEIAEILRGKNGCAWDIEQTSKTLKSHLIEEAYELYDAIENDNKKDMQEELGDLLYQVYAHCQIASEEDKFNIDDVADGISEKLIHRHPHVFGDKVIESADEVSEEWEKIKKKEKSHRESILDGIPEHLPGLLKAYRMQQKVSRVGFEWKTIDGAKEKLFEEIDELKEAIEFKDDEHIIDEAGDVLFVMANILRFKKINPEEAIQKANKKFKRRFSSVEKLAAEKGREIESMTLEEMDELWNEVKRNE